MFKKTLAIAVVAMFCVSAFVMAADTDDSSAADENKLTYSFYLELKDGTNSYSARLPDVTIDGSEMTGDNYQAAVTAACTAAGLTVTFGSYNMISSLVADAVTYEGSAYSDWGTDNYYNYSVYYSKGGQWNSASLNESTTYVLVFDKYEFSEPANPENYFKNGDATYGYYWTPLPTVGHPVEYQVYFQLNDGDASFSQWVKNIQFGISGDSLKNARLIGAAKAGFEIVNSSGATSITSITAGGHTYAKHGSYGGDEYYNYAAYFAKNGSWVDLQAVDLDSQTVIAHVFDLYKFSDPQDSSYYYHAPAYGMDAYWTKAVDVSVPGSGSPDDDNQTLLIVGAVAIFVAVLIAVVFAAMPKKH